MVFIFIKEKCTFRALHYEGQGNLACCSPWGHKESDTTEQLNNNKNYIVVLRKGFVYRIPEVDSTKYYYYFLTALCGLRYLSLNQG